MKIPAILALSIWALVVGGNIIQVQILPPQTFMDTPRLPWFVVFLPIVIIFGALSRRRNASEATLRPWVDRRFGQGMYREFIKTLRLELLFAAMCFGIVLSAFARDFFFKTPILPPEIIGFFISGGLAFVAAYFIRRAREGPIARQ